MFDYNEFRFLYPPRPENAVSPIHINLFQNKGWWGNYKMNGTCSLVALDPSGHMHTRTRHNTPHKAWSPSTSRMPKLMAKYATPGKWSVFVAELLHSKTPETKDTLYIFDMIVRGSKELVGTTYGDRQEMLQGIFSDVQADKDTHYEIQDGLWLAKNHKVGLRERFETVKACVSKEIEGLVMKDPSGTLGLMDRTGGNQSWQVKCRIPNFEGYWGF